MSAIPTATYRLQFHRGFTFEDARRCVPYLARLGVSHLYASPIFRAAPGSTHGYDVCDHNELNPELGTRADFEALSAELKAHGLGLILDFVPNHMGIDRALNPWWRDVLENGPSSPFARFFDIDWQPVKRELENKVLLPVLGEQYGRVLETGELRVEFAGGDFLLRHGELTLPLAPRTTRPLLQQAAALLTPAPAELESIINAIDHLPGRTETAQDKITIRARERQIIRDRLQRLCTEIPAVQHAIFQALAEWHSESDPARLDRLDALISAQPYRLSSWRVAGEEINYRRFFDVNSLAAIRMELPEVFEATHRLLFELIDAGHVAGVRIDHIDGLAFPGDYLSQLRARGGADLYILVEKILGPDEHFRPDWPAQGTTGYEFANQVTQVLLATPGVEEIASLYLRFLGMRLRYSEIIYQSKKLVMQTSLASEVNALGHALNRISESNRWYRDFTLNALTHAVREVIACFPVYRTYIDPTSAPEPADQHVLARAVALARRRNPTTEHTIFEFLHDVLSPPSDNAHPVDEVQRRSFVIRFQQCTGPITAKGVEDTAFYVFNRLVACNEVGGEPEATGADVATFHRQNAVRLQRIPHSLLATSTHDTKRSEDVRARIAALSEMPEEWGRALRHWRTMNSKHRREIDGEFAPDTNEEYLLYQTLLGAWPHEGLNPGNRARFIERIQAYMMKALREAKVNSSWLEPNAAWDSAVSDFIAAILAPGAQNRFPRSLSRLAHRISESGMVNSLAQTVLKLTCPGVPDLYQGTELWDLSLVDPDNRRPVDYKRREEALGSLGGVPPSELLARWTDGRLKLFVIHRLLCFRREAAALFAEGRYTPVEVIGSRADHVIAFERHHDTSGRLLVVVPRLTAGFGFPPLGECWADTQLRLSPGDWCDVFTGQQHTTGACRELFTHLPVAVLRGL